MAGFRALIGAEHLATRIGIRLALEEEGVHVCSEAADAAEVLGRASAEHPDCCLVEAELPGGGVATTREVIDREPATTVVLLSRRPSERGLLAAVRAGAAGYLPLSMDPGRLAAAVNDACTGVPAIPRRFVTGLIDALRQSAGQTSDGLPLAVARKLSPREREVCEALVEHASTSEIAMALGISPVTVRRHISSVAEKLEVSDRQSVVRSLCDSQIFENDRWATRVLTQPNSLSGTT